MENRWCCLGRGSQGVAKLGRKSTEQHYRSRMARRVMQQCSMIKVNNSQVTTDLDSLHKLLAEYNDVFGEPKQLHPTNHWIIKFP